jgi:hypothetical protein
MLKEWEPWRARKLETDLLKATQTKIWHCQIIFVS